MTTIINASPTNGLTQSADGSGVLKVQSNGVTTNALAWVNFDGTNAFSPNPSTSAIRAAYNVSSISKNGTGDYTLNFTSALSDANYAVVGSGSMTGALILGVNDVAATPTTSTVRISTYATAGVVGNAKYANVAIFGN